MQFHGSSFILDSFDGLRRAALILAMSIVFNLLLYYVHSAFHVPLHNVHVDITNGIYTHIQLG